MTPGTAEDIGAVAGVAPGVPVAAPVPTPAGVAVVPEANAAAAPAAPPPAPPVPGTPAAPEHPSARSLGPTPPLPPLAPAVPFAGSDRGSGPGLGLGVAASGLGYPTPARAVASWPSLPAAPSPLHPTGGGAATSPSGGLPLPASVSPAHRVPTPTLGRSPATVAGTPRDRVSALQAQEAWASPRASGGVDSPTFLDDLDGQGFSTPRTLSAHPSAEYYPPYFPGAAGGVALPQPVALAPPPCLLPFTPLPDAGYVPEDTRLHALLSYGYESDAAVDSELATATTSVNARNASGATPLHVAAKLAYFHGLMTLVNHGADLDAVDDFGGFRAWAWGLGLGAG